MNTVTRPAAGWKAQDLALIAVFAALVSASALVPGISVGGAGVPITVQTLMVILSGLILGPSRAFAAVALYLLLGLAGLPIFSQGRAGLGVLAGPTAGYLLAFPLVALLAGFFTVRVLGRGMRPRSLWLFASAFGSSILVVHTLGPLGMMLNARLSPGQAFLADLAFYPGDIVKNLVAVALAMTVHRAFPGLLLRPAQQARAAATARAAAAAGAAG